MPFGRFLLAALAAFALALPAVASDGGFDRLERSLRLNPYQQQQFDLAVRATQRAMFSIGMGALQFKTRLGMELLKDRPDPRALELAQDELLEMSRPHVRAAREEWLRFYSMLDEDQVGTARNYLEERLRKLDQLAEHLIGKLAAELPRPRRRAEPLQE
jgi:hypothetical protein